jgi:hypothetical protein
MWRRVVFDWPLRVTKSQLSALLEGDDVTNFDGVDIQIGDEQRQAGAPAPTAAAAGPVPSRAACAVGANAPGAGHGGGGGGGGVTWGGAWGGGAGGGAVGSAANPSAPAHQGGTAGKSSVQPAGRFLNPMVVPDPSDVARHVIDSGFDTRCGPSFLGLYGIT